MAPSALQTAGPYPNETNQPQSPSQYEPAMFDIQKHMCYSPPEETITLEAINISSPTATSPVAVTVPFPLLTAEGVRALRADIFRRDLVAKYGSWKYPGVYRIRGYGADAPFAYSLWRSQAMQEACSSAAGVELEIIYDYEIGQLNVQLDAGIDRTAGITENLPPATPPRHSAPVDGNMASVSGGEKALVSAWHTDSYPWVCVLMLSDPVGMEGGETALRNGYGSILKIKPPGLGYAVMMQGGCIEHAALPCLGEGERITFVTSFRAKDPRVSDCSSLTTVRPISKLDELYRQWSHYRVNVVMQRSAIMERELEVRGRTAGEIRNLVKQWAKDQIDYLQKTVDEMT